MTELKTMSDRPARPIVAAFVTLAATIATTLALGACAGHRTLEEEIDQSNLRVLDTLRMRAFDTDEPVEIRTSGAVTVDVENFAGDVTVRADPMADTTVVEVRRLVDSGGFTGFGGGTGPFGGQRIRMEDLGDLFGGGLGDLFDSGRISADYPLMFAVLFALAALGIVLFYFVVFLERIFAGWAERSPG